MEDPTIYEVFRREKAGAPMVHAGTVTAAGPDLALIYARECFGRFSYFDCLWHSDLKVLCLFNQTPRFCFARFGRVNQIKAKDILGAAGAGVKTIAVVRRIRDEATILENSPLFALGPRAKIDNRQPENSDD